MGNLLPPKEHMMLITGITGHDGLAQARALSNAFATVSEQVSPAVVHIKVRGEAPAAPQMHPQLPPWFMPRQPHSQPRHGQGSGVIISAEGKVLTNHHVIDGADSIIVVMNDGRELDAKVIGSDPGSDLPWSNYRKQMSNTLTRA